MFTAKINLSNREFTAISKLGLHNSLIFHEEKINLRKSVAGPFPVLEVSTFHIHNNTDRF